MNSIRAFIALPVPADVIGNIVRCQEEMAAQAGDRVRWTPEEQIHLTLQFLANISTPDVEQIQARLAGIMKPLHLRAHGLGGVPSLRNPPGLLGGPEGAVGQLA